MRKNHSYICRSLIFFVLVEIISPTATAQKAFSPPENPKEVYTTKVASGAIKLDGILNEPEWNRPPKISGFTQRDPLQGEAASVDTEVRILFNETFLYISAVCYDSLKDPDKLRVLNLQRDFAGYSNDRFSVAIDGLKDRRNAVGFEVTPYGAQREIQVIDGDEWDGNVNWDALWYARTAITDSAWIVEMAIPWKTLRYNENSDEMLISFNRNIRRNREWTTWPAYPRIFSHFRMAYAAVLKGLEPPPPSANFQINPYVLATSGETTEGDAPMVNSDNLKFGGEFKWAITPNTVVDGTINTDFAQADVDQQVQNLTRFSVLFPERRQFFLENANIFRTSSTDLIQPFFSRRIGLDDDGQPISLDGGLRLTSQTNKQTSGMLVMRQRETSGSPAAHFAVGRYVRNFSEQSRLGGMVTWRQDDAFEGNGSTTNATATINSFLRPKQSLSLETMISASTDSEVGDGLAGHFAMWQETNWLFMSLIGQFATENYLPGSGFLGFADFVRLRPRVDLDLRPTWLPDFIRSYGPDGQVDIYWRASDGSFQQAIANLAVVDMEFDKGGEFEIRINQEWQQLDEGFSPLAIDINSGYYQFGTMEIGIASDFSRKFAGSLRYEGGGFCSGRISSWRGSFRISPIPYVELTGSYRYNEFRDLGEENRNLNTHLLSTRARLALNPRVQLIGSYQWNSANEADIWNLRFSWEYRPLSFIYIVFNSNQSDDNLLENRFSQKELIGKITYLHQF